MMKMPKRPKGVKIEYRFIKANGRLMRVLIVKPALRKSGEKVPGVLWVHGGGYVSGMPEMVYMSRAIDLVTKCGAIVVSPAYTLSFLSPYPTALKECHDALVYLKEHAEELGVDSERICVGGESAGGGMTAALCMYAKDMNSVNIAFQMPLYPMLDCFDTESSKDNHAKVWNTTKNHLAWKLYLFRYRNKEKIPCYASPARRSDYSNLPPCYTFVGDEEPFYCETLEYVNMLNEAGIEAKVDVYKGCYHAFDMMEPLSRNAKLSSKRFVGAFNNAMKKYRAPQIS